MPRISHQYAFDYLESELDRIEREYLKSDLDIWKALQKLANKVQKLEEELAKCRNPNSKTE